LLSQDCAAAVLTAKAVIAATRIIRLIVISSLLIALTPQARM
jgi:hypothetical protein